ncbi:Cell wall protein PRY3 [Dufourea novaeangliae]|uniref:Cell wall protein PRY3 n=1 Tax=Dufourea novaeangliae TaxID=178035 RepID=A0A154PEW8_DUFNO|nr:Cell wall protein PRY3 [Dufourea novaeangliae]
MEHFPPEFVDGFLELHNEYREFHNSSPLEIVDELNELAQEWADDLAKRGVLAYKSDPEYGENIFLGDTAETIKPEDPLKFWYREGRYFKYGEESVENSEDVRHFTQLVWAATTSVGLGMATDSDGKVYFVCFYQPPGNVSGEYAENVLSPVQQSIEYQLHQRVTASNFLCDCHSLVLNFPSNLAKLIDPQPRVEWLVLRSVARAPCFGLIDAEYESWAGRERKKVGRRIGRERGGNEQLASEWKIPREPAQKDQCAVGKCPGGEAN